MLKIIINIFLCIICFQIDAIVITTNKITDIEIEFAKADNETLIVMDCNDVLIEPIDLVLTPVGKEIRNKVLKSSQRTCEEMIALGSIITMQSKSQLVHPKWPILIRVLQSRGIKVLSLTTCSANKFGYIDSMSNFRLNELLQFDIDFRKSWNNVNVIQFPAKRQTLYPYPKYSYPVFIYGMLFADRADKGDILLKFLGKLPGKKFKKIIFIDDKISNVQSVKNKLAQINIEFIGIEYVYSKTKKRSAFKEEKSKKQLEILIKENRWVSDFEI